MPDSPTVLYSALFEHQGLRILVLRDRLSADDVEESLVLDVGSVEPTSITPDVTQRQWLPPSGRRRDELATLATDGGEGGGRGRRRLHRSAAGRAVRRRPSLQMIPGHGDRNFKVVRRLPWICN